MSSSWPNVCAAVALPRSKLCARAGPKSAGASSKRKKSDFFMRAVGICVALASYSTMGAFGGRKYAAREYEAGNRGQGAERWWGGRGARANVREMSNLANNKVFTCWGIECAGMIRPASARS